MRNWVLSGSSLRERERVIVNQMNTGTVSKATLGAYLGTVRFFLERAREGHRQSDKDWNCFKGNVGETPERRGGQHFQRG